jgi:hypothetical protein
MVTGKCLLELVALLAEKGAKVLELRVQVLACGGLHRDAACARLLQQLAHWRKALSDELSACSLLGINQLDEVDVALVSSHVARRRLHRMQRGVSRVCSVSVI